MSDGINIEKIKKIADIVDNDVMSMMEKLGEGATLFDLMTYSELVTLQCAKLISMSSLKDGKRVNVRTVINDIQKDTLNALDVLVIDNPELADDYKWPSPTEEKSAEE